MCGACVSVWGRRHSVVGEMHLITAILKCKGERVSEPLEQMGGRGLGQPMVTFPKVGPPVGGSGQALVSRGAEHSHQWEHLWAIRPGLPQAGHPE